MFIIMESLNILLNKAHLSRSEISKHEIFNIAIILHTKCSKESVYAKKYIFH